MRCTLEKTLEEEEEDEGEAEEEEEDLGEAEEEEGDEDEAEEGEEEVDNVFQVAIPGDGDCFYSAIVEAFLRNGVDVVSLFAGRIGCEVVLQYFDSIKNNALKHRQRTVG